MHLVHGYGAGRCLARVRKHEEVFAFPDVLSCGPADSVTPATVPAFMRSRAQFWRQILGDFDVEPTASLADGLLRACSAATVTLWTGRAVSEQLFAALFCALVAAGPHHPTICIVPYHEVQGRSGAMVAVRAVAMLSEQELRTPPPTITLTPEEILALAQAWSAWASPDPSGLVSLSRLSDTPAVVWTAFRSLLHRYPERATGLSSWDLALLQGVRAHGPRLVAVIGHALGETDTADIVGDGWLFWRLRRLADDLPFPLVSLDTMSSEMRGCSVSLTDSGIQVLDGLANAVSLNGMDDRVGGVHLHRTEGRAWVREADQIVPWKLPV